MNNLKFFSENKLNDVEKRVLQYIIDHIDEVMTLGVRGIAKNNYTSTSVIMRLTKKLGYSGFVDMHYKIYPLIKKQLSFNASTINQSQSNPFSSSNIFEYNDITKLQLFAEKILELDRFIFLYATGFSSIITEYFCKKLLVLGKKNMIASGSDSAAVFENNLEDIDIFLAVSKSGMTQQVLNKARTAKENNIFVVSFTNEHANSLAELSDINFKIEDHCRLDDLNIFPNSFFPNVLMLFEAITNEYHKLIAD